jgi:hypothetical protein
MPSDIRRFVLAMPSIPHLEAIFLLRGTRTRVWEVNEIAKNLYVDEETASGVVQRLCCIGICAPAPDCSDRFIYQPESTELDELITRVAGYYSRNLIEVTNLVHASSGPGSTQRIQQFADAFKLRKEE